MTIGGCRGAVLEAVEELGERGIEVDYMRVRAFPFHPDVEPFLAAHEMNFVVEQNRDGQLRKMLIIETGAAKESLASILYYGGYPMSCHHVMDGLAPHVDLGADPAGLEPASQTAATQGATP